MILSATLKKDDVEGDLVRYVDSFGGKDSFLSGAMVIKASDLPDPPPALLRVSLAWYQAPRAHAEADHEGGNSPTEGPAHRISQGDVVKVIKSRTSGVENPAEWLQQHLSKTGVVLWVTAGGASVDLSGEAVWFAYDELEPVL
jgi:hypothetical protein